MSYSLSEARTYISIDASHNLATVDVSDFSYPIQVLGSKMMVQVDVSKAGGFLNFQKSVDNKTWFTNTDLSIGLDASVAKTSYLGTFTVTPFSWIKPTIDEAGYGVLSGIRILVPFDK